MQPCEFNTAGVISAVNLYHQIFPGLLQTQMDSDIIFGSIIRERSENMKEYSAPQAEVISFDKDYDYVVTSSVGSVRQDGASASSVSDQ